MAFWQPRMSCDPDRCGSVRKSATLSLRDWGRRGVEQVSMALRGRLEIGIGGSLATPPLASASWQASVCSRLVRVLAVGPDVREIPSSVPTSRTRSEFPPPIPPRRSVLARIEEARNGRQRPIGVAKNVREVPVDWELLRGRRTPPNTFGGRRTRQCGAPGRTRTSTMFPPPDFESGASTNSATGA